jgi:hypothetical protein
MTDIDPPPDRQTWQPPADGDMVRDVTDAISDLRAHMDQPYHPEPIILTRSSYNYMRDWFERQEAERNARSNLGHLFYAPLGTPPPTTGDTTEWISLGYTDGGLIADDDGVLRPPDSRPYPPPPTDPDMPVADTEPGQDYPTGTGE